MGPAASLGVAAAATTAFLLLYGVLRRLFHRFDDMDNVSTLVHKELMPNSGASLVDRVKSTNDQVVSLHRRFDGLIDMKDAEHHLMWEVLEQKLGVERPIEDGDPRLLGPRPSGPPRSAGRRREDRSS